jgi:hypothetical protein
MNDFDIDFLILVENVLLWTPVNPEPKFATGYDCDDELSEDPGEPVPPIDLREVFA